MADINDEKTGELIINDIGAEDTKPSEPAAENNIIMDFTVVADGDFSKRPKEVDDMTTVFDENGRNNGVRKAEYAEFENQQDERAAEISEVIKSNVLTDDVTGETEPVAEDEPSEEKNKKAFDIMDMIEMVVFSVVFVVALFTFGVRNVFVDGDSMKSTLLDKDMLIITDVVDYNYGDIIVFMPDNAEKDARLNKPFIKRVIALSGDVVDVNYEENTVYVNGEAVEEPYLGSLVMTDKGNITFPYTVPEHHIFFMGDNRNDSWDSRYEEVGTVDSRLVMGKVLLRLFPFDRFGAVK